VTSRPYFSIGEVLGLLLEEFPDITISKIRFLETQGLIDPERTPSGYRKFYESDLERLRFILREQKDRYLPLRVIKERLETSDDTLPMEPRPMPSGASWATTARRPDDELARPLAVTTIAPPATEHTTDHDVGLVARLLEAPESVERAMRASAEAQHRAVASPAPTSGSTPELADAPAPTATRPDPPANPRSSASTPARVRDDRQFDAAELCAEAGIERATLEELESYGLVASRAMGGAAIYGADALHIARVAGRLIDHGLEVRHLRTWRMNAEKESALFEQLVVPLVRQRNPQSRHQAAETVEELLELGGQLRDAILRGAMGQFLEH